MKVESSRYKKIFIRPDQSGEVIVDYVEQLNVGRDIPIQTVAYDCANHVTNVSDLQLNKDTHGS